MTSTELFLTNGELFFGNKSTNFIQNSPKTLVVRRDPMLVVGADDLPDDQLVRSRYSCKYVWRQEACTFKSYHNVSRYSVLDSF